MDCPANQRDEEGQAEDPITYAPLDPERHLRVAQLCYHPEALADWLLHQQELTDVYGNELSDRELLDLLHFLDGRDAERYRNYGRLARLIARQLEMTLAYLIHLEQADTPETMTHYASQRAAVEQARRLTRMDRKARMIAVHVVVDDMRFTAPLQHFIKV
jgi:hypothetical protein